MANASHFLSKVVVRNLPVGMDEAGFRQLAGEQVFQQIDYFYFAQGRSKLASPDVNSKAFLNFTHRAALLTFTEKLDGHVFLDSKGVSLSCSVEYAHSQLKPKKTGGAHAKRATKVDPLVGTIEDDEHFKQFLADLAAPVATPSSELDPAPVRGLTPLLAAIKQKDEKKFQEKQSRKSKKKVPKKAAAAPAKATAAGPPSKPKKRKRKKPAETGPQFGAVKVLGNTANVALSSAPITTPATAPPADKKKKRIRKPKVKKTANTTTPTKPAPAKT